MPRLCRSLSHVLSLFLDSNSDGYYFFDLRFVLSVCVTSQRCYVRAHLWLPMAMVVWSTCVDVSKCAIRIIIQLYRLLQKYCIVWNSLLCIEWNSNNNMIGRVWQCWRITEHAAATRRIRPYNDNNNFLIVSRFDWYYSLTFIVIVIAAAIVITNSFCTADLYWLMLMFLRLGSYRIFAVHGGYTSGAQLLVWPNYGFHIYCLEESLLMRGTLNLSLFYLREWIMFWLSYAKLASLLEI